MTYDGLLAAEDAAGRAYYDKAIADAVAPVQAALDDLIPKLAAATATVTLLTTQVGVLEQTVQRDETLIADLRAQIAALTPKKALVGVALADQLPATYDAFRAKFPEISGQRIYHVPGELPATYATSKAKHLDGEDHAFVSFKPSIADMKSGAASGWARNFGLSCPDGTLFCCQHEPEQKTKNISPTDFVAATNRLFGDMGKTPALRTICLMEYQFALQGTAYMNGLDPNVIDMVACDFYTGKGNGRTVQQLCEPFFTKARQMFPQARLAIGELGVSKQSLVTDRGQWLKDGLVWLRANGIDTYYYQLNVGNEADWALTDAEWTKALS